MLIKKSLNSDPNFSSLTMSQYVDELKAKKVLLLSSRDLRKKPFLYGEDNYISMLLSEFNKKAIPVTMVLVKEDPQKERENIINNIERSIDDQTLIILHNVSPFNILKTKLRRKATIVMPIYFLSNRTCSFLSNLNNKWGPVFWQVFVDEFIVSSPIVAERLRKMGLIRKISVMPPKYSCPCCCLDLTHLKKFNQTDILPSEVNAVYIGAVFPPRFVLSKIINTLNKDEKRHYTLTIYTSSSVPKQTFRNGNVTVIIYMRTLTDQEKCKILSECDAFVAPFTSTTIDPPLSVIEAEYHGKVILRFG